MLILLIVATNEGISMTELANQVGTSKVQVSRSIAGLEERAIVQRRHNQENRRVVNVYTTKEGEKLFKQKENQVKQQLSETLCVLSLEDYQEVNQHFLALMIVLSNYQELRRKTCKENNVVVKKHRLAINQTMFFLAFDRARSHAFYIETLH